jgi:hypothetical protein
VTATYLDRLAARSASVGSVLCLGLDPDPASLPHGFPAISPAWRRSRPWWEAAAPHAAAVKPNLAFFEAFGAPGIAALERIRARLPADLPVSSTRSAATSARPPPGRRSRCSTGSGPTP